MIMTMCQYLLPTLSYPHCIQIKHRRNEIKYIVSLFLSFLKTIWKMFQKIDIRNTLMELSKKYRYIKKLVWLIILWWIMLLLSVKRVDLLQLLAEVVPLVILPIHYVDFLRLTDLHLQLSYTQNVLLVRREFWKPNHYQIWIWTLAR